MKNKFICIIFTVLAICALAVPTFAIGNATAVASTSTPHRDETVSVTVRISGVSSFKAGSLVVSYGEGLELVSITSKVNGLTVDAKLASKSAVFYSLSGVSVDGDLLALTFKVKSNAAFADNAVNVTLVINEETLNVSTTLKVSCYHSFNNWAYWSMGTHTRTCYVCGEREVVDHVFENSCDDVCDPCGATREVTHEFGEEWVGDLNGHWHECTLCGLKIDESEHNPGAEAGEYTDQLCLDCGVIVTPALGHTHKYSDKLLFDENGHWQVCTGCYQAAEAVAHEYDSDCDDVCDACSYQREVTHQPGQWEHDATAHWKVCSDCQKELERHEHNWDAGYVQSRPTTEQDGLAIYRCIDCMEEKQEVLPMEVIPEPEPEFKPELQIGDYFEWWVWLCVGAGGGVILTSIVFGIVLAISAHKRKKELCDEVEV